MNTTASRLEADEVAHWYACAVSEVGQRLGSDLTRGLSVNAANARAEIYGPNEVAASDRTTWPTILARQFVNALIWILLVAAAISVVVGEWTDALTILAIVMLNGVLGFVQEWKAERAVGALRQMLSPQCRVLRDGAEHSVAARELVPGDVVLLETGNRVPADLRVAAAVDLKVDESALTGESDSVAKQAAAVSVESPLAERSSMLWMGTSVTNGRSRGFVVAIGADTQFGRIAALTSDIATGATPLQRKLESLGKQLGLLAVAVSVLVAAAGWLSGKSLVEMFMTGVSLAVAVVPEGLPAVVTITLALGIRAMVTRRALLRRLQAAEALGSATVICTDKTGTLTQNQMTVQTIWLPAGSVQLTGVGYEPTGHFQAESQSLDATTRPDLLELLRAGVACNHAKVTCDDKGCWYEVGEPTEAALVVAALKASLPADDPAQIDIEFPFNSDRKRMTVVESKDGASVAWSKGAPEVILARCSEVLDGPAVRPLTATDLEAAERAYQEMAGSGLRTLAIARHELIDGDPRDEQTVEANLTLLGIVGIIDPPRPEVPEAIARAQSAGIAVYMITGDAAPTALAIAQRVGLSAEVAVTGSELEEMSDGKLQSALERGAVFARTTPEHKLRIVRLLQSQGHIVGMTGDGVNDAPALKKADIGIAMGLRGTDVARGASDIVLTDDNFSSIINAVEEGRRQYDNIQKFVRYLLSSNTGEVVAIFLNIVIGGPLILLPVQILWMNLVTDGLTAVALGLEPVERDIMSRPPRSPKAPILDRSGVAMILIPGVYMGLVTLGVFHFYCARGGESLLIAQTVAFTGMIIAEKVNVLNFRALRTPLARVGFWTNKWILLAIAGTVGLQLAAVYVPVLQRALHTLPLRGQDWLVIVTVSLPVFVIMEAPKYWRARASL